MSTASDRPADGPEAVTDDAHTDRLVAELVSRQVLESRDGAGLDRLADLEAKLARAVRSSQAESTLKAYRSDWEDFATWCETVGLGSLPAAPATVAAYLADLAEPPDDRKPLAISTIQRRKASIGEAQEPTPIHH